MCIWVALSGRGGAAAVNIRHFTTHPPPLFILIQRHPQELDGWLWFDEKDQVNVLARLAPGIAGAGAGAGIGEERKFLVFEQRKYGFEGLR